MLDVPGLLARRRGCKVYLDTNIFIYVLNNSTGYAEPCLALLQACADRHLVGVTGDVTLAESRCRSTMLRPWLPCASC